MAPMWRRLLALLMVFGLVAAACGSDGDGGEVSGGYKIIYLVDREDAIQPEYSNIRSTVLSEFLKRRDDQSLRKYLDNLKKWYDVTRNIKD